MKQHPRRAVIDWELRPNPHPESSRLWPQFATVVLECGHRINVGVSGERPRRMACHECTIAEARNAGGTPK